MACPLEDIGNENKCEDCEGEMHEPTVVRSYMSNVWLPPQENEPRGNLTAIPRRCCFGQRHPLRSRACPPSLLLLVTSSMSFSPFWPALSMFTRAFFELSYPTPSPASPDSFPTSRYYETGPLDACFIVSTIVVFALARDIVRLRIATPIANKWLFGSTKGAVALTNGKKGDKTLTNGSGHAVNGNGNGHYSSARNRVRERNVVRFAEQSWSLVYYGIWWPFGVVRSFRLLLLTHANFDLALVYSHEPPTLTMEP